jgi:hypothetical protein
MGNSSLKVYNASYLHPGERADDGDQQNFVEENAGIFKEYLLCIVFPAEEGRFSEEGKSYINILRSNGLETLSYYGYDKSEIYVLIRADLDVLRNYADDVDYVMLLDPVALESTASKGNKMNSIEPFNITDMPAVSCYRPYEFIYGKYSLRVNEELYHRHEDEATPFDATSKIKLTAQLVERISSTGERLRIKTYINELKTLKGYFPLHDRKALAQLEDLWLRYPVTPWKQPYNDLKRYFGEKIAMYFIFLGHYTWWCAIASTVGVPLQVAVFVLEDYSAPFLPFFAYFIALWGILMLEFWKRSESEWAMKWGTLGCETSETDRADFDGVPIKSFIDGKDMIHFPSAKRRRLISFSMLSIATLICLVLGAVSSIYVIRFTIQPYIGTAAQMTASCINASQISIASMIYYNLATSLNEKENHRTETMHEDSLISKIFLFEFVNNYASFFYLAFFAELMQDCPANIDGGCMFPLTLNLIIIFITRTVTGNFLEIAMPAYTYRSRLGAIRRSHNIDPKLLTQPEQESLLEPYDSHSASISDFIELAVQFGYGTMFAAALPIAPLLSLLANFVENTSDAWKFLRIHQRPQPQACEDIGTWQTIFTIVSIASVITNSSLAVFTMTVTDSFSVYRRFWIYVGFQWTCFLIQAAIMQSVPDVAPAVSVQQERTRFLVDKIIDQTPDDDIVEFVSTSSHKSLVQRHPLKDKVNLEVPVFTLTPVPKQAQPCAGMDGEVILVPAKIDGPGRGEELRVNKADITLDYVSVNATGQTSAVAEGGREGRGGTYANEVFVVEHISDTGVVVGSRISAWTDQWADN